MNCFPSRVSPSAACQNHASEIPRPVTSESPPPVGKPFSLDRAKILCILTSKSYGWLCHIHMRQILMCTSWLSKARWNSSLASSSKSAEHTLPIFRIRLEKRLLSPRHKWSNFVNSWALMRSPPVPALWMTMLNVVRRRHSGMRETKGATNKSLCIEERSHVSSWTLTALDKAFLSKYQPRTGLRCAILPRFSPTSCYCLQRLSPYSNKANILNGWNERRLTCILTISEYFQVL